MQNKSSLKKYKQKTIAIVSGAILLQATYSPISASAFCFEEAGALYGIAPEIISAISQQETGGRPDLPPSWNTNGSYDVGLMQINSNWYYWSPEVRALWPQIQDPCTNVMVGTWILAKCMNKYGYNWKAIGCYHSQTPEKRDHYAKQIAEKIFGKKNVQQMLATGRRESHVTPSN